MKTLVMLTVLGVFALLASLYLRLGANKEVVITQAELGPYQVVYKNHLGAYYKISSVIEEVETWAKSNGIPCRKSFGEYADDPSEVTEDRLHSRGGCILETAPPISLPKDFLIGSIPKRTYASAVFEGAPSLGPLKIYPKIESYIKDRGLTRDGPSILEIYEVLPENGVRTTYLFPVKP